MKQNKNKPLSMHSYNNADVTVHSVVTKYQGFFKMNEYSLQHQLFSGDTSTTFTREVFERGDAVVVIPYDVKQDKVLLIEQFRVGAIKGKDSPWLLEFIAGMFDDNESPTDVAIREAKEETNITLCRHDLVPIMQYLSSPGATSERIHLYLAHFDSTTVDTGAVFGLPAENEDIKLHLVSRMQALDLLTQGKITNAATIIGLQWLAINYALLAEKESD
ncbi:MAG: NUDIX domain-containing protein [Colwellia sp.]